MRLQVSVLNRDFIRILLIFLPAVLIGHHSVIGRPSQGGLHFPEYVVYRGEQAYPEYLITYQIVKPETGCEDDTTRWCATTPKKTTNRTKMPQHQRSTMSKATAILTESGKKFSELLIITPAVSIDESYQNDIKYNNNTTTDQNSNSSTANLLSNNFDTRRSNRWRWCTFICAAVRCFRNNQTNTLNDNIDVSKCNFIHTYDITDRSSNYLNNSDNNSNVTYQLWHTCVTEYYF